MPVSADRSIDQPTRLRRRSVLRTAAWAAPAVSVAATAPAFASSPAGLVIASQRVVDESPGQSSKMAVRATFAGTIAPNTLYTLTLTLAGASAVNNLRPRMGLWTGGTRKGTGVPVVVTWTYRSGATPLPASALAVAAVDAVNVKGRTVSGVLTLTP